MSEQSSSSMPQVQVPVVYNPSEVIGLFNEFLARKSNGLIYVRGIYRPGNGHQYNGVFYDVLRDEFSQKELTLVISHEIRSQLQEGNLVEFKGFVDRRVSNDCSVRLLLNVSGASVVQQQTVSEDDVRRIEIRNAKARAGFKNIDGILEAAIYADRRPSVGLVYAQTSITDKDFNAGKRAAGAMIDFKEYRATFTKPDEFVGELRKADADGNDCVCIVRGGGAGLEALEDLAVLECIAGMKTPVITAVGHTPDKVFINEIADLEKETPSLLGTYFKDLVESVAKKKADSMAALSKKIEAQFKQQLDTAKKQNEELQKKIGELTKAGAEAQKLHDEQVKASQKQLDELAKGNSIARQKDREQMEALQKQLAILTENSKSQSEGFTKQLGKMQEDMNTLTHENKSLTARYAEEKSKKEALERNLLEERNRKGGKGLVVAVVALSVLLILSLILR
jgi:hypothetical protein